MKKEYLYELHLHTQETSPCGNVPGALAASLYAQAGYDGLCVTDHYYRSIVENLPGRTPRDRVRHWMSGFNAARAAGESLGLRVLLGMELRYDNSCNDYLVYGMTEDILMQNPDLYAWDPESFFPFAEENGLVVIQAHPYRYACRPADPHFLHGVEVFNGHRRHDSRNGKTALLAEAWPHLIQLAGSDFHQEQDVAGAAMLFPEPIETASALAQALKNRRISGQQTGTWRYPEENPA